MPHHTAAAGPRHLDTPADEWAPAISPDGAWLAYERSDRGADYDVLPSGDDFIMLALRSGLAGLALIPDAQGMVRSGG